MKKRIVGLFIAAGLLCSAPAMAEMTGNINAFLGAKGLNSDDWYADAHSETGVLFDVGGTDWPVLLAVDVLGSHGDWHGFVYRPSTATIDYYEEDVKTSELNLGVRKYWNSTGNMYPYIGGGVAFIHLRAEGRLNNAAPYTDSGDGTGLWVGGGIQWRFNHFNLGFSVRASAAEVSLDSGNYQGGGGHTALLLGYHF